MGAGTDAETGAGTGASTGASTDASAGTCGGIGAGEDVGAGAGEGTGASSVGAGSRIGWADAELGVSEVMVVESDEDDDKLGQDIPEEEMVTVGEVDWAGAGGANTVIRRP